MKRKVTALAAAAVLGLGVAGCEPGATGPAEPGGVAVDLQGGSAVAGGASRSMSGGGSGSMDATVAVAARVYLATEGGEWLELTRGEARQTVRADGRDGVRVLTEGAVGAGAYRRIRIEFVEVRAVVTGGVSIDLPVLEGEVAVDMGADERVVVERAIDLVVEPDAEARVLVSLDSGRWLAAVDAGTGRVAESEFEGAIRVEASEG